MPFMFLYKGCIVPVHRGFEVKLFQNPNGVVDNVNNYPIRLVLSSYLLFNQLAKKYFSIHLRILYENLKILLGFKWIKWYS